LAAHAASAETLTPKNLLPQICAVIADKKHWAANEQAISNWQIAISLAE
jgi:hypothetical protein